MHRQLRAAYEGEGHWLCLEPHVAHVHGRPCHVQEDRPRRERHRLRAGQRELQAASRPTRIPGPPRRAGLQRLPRPPRRGRAALPERAPPAPADQGRRQGGAAGAAGARAGARGGGGSRALAGHPGHARGAVCQELEPDIGAALFQQGSVRGAVAEEVQRARQEASEPLRPDQGRRVRRLGGLQGERLHDRSRLRLRQVRGERVRVPLQQQVQSFLQLEHGRGAGAGFLHDREDRAEAARPVRQALQHQDVVGVQSARMQRQRRSR
mmetsp:Transcript_106975/g.312847  ORF Transcript_106975/g.312847 Transcript_106975/m.312847 type:complete len:266 (-) Transcript_106975:361-1158(-)